MEFFKSNEYIDPRSITKDNLIRSEVQNQLKTDFDEKITDSFNVVKKMVNTWDINILYYEGHQVPPGFQGDIVAEFRAKNGLNTLRKDEDDAIFVMNNMCKTMIDRYVGQYTDAKKEIAVTRASNNPRHRNITVMTKRMLEYYSNHIAGTDEDDFEDMWTDYRIPAIEQSNIMGLYFTSIDCNKRRLIETGGAIEMDTVSPKDVGIDPDSVKKYFKDANYFIRRRKRTLEYVRKLAKRNGFDPSGVTPDNDWRQDHSINEDLFVKTNDKNCTVYEIQYRMTFEKAVDLAEYYGVTEQIGKPESMVEGEELVYFKAEYYKPIGTLSHIINPYKMFTLIPYYNKKSNIRLHPLSDIEFFRVLQDLSNIMDTLQLDNARQRNRLKLFVAKQLADQYGIDEISDFVRTGGALEFQLGESEDIRKLIGEFNVESLGNELQPLAMKYQSYLQNAGFSTDAGEGKYPKEVMSGKGILALQREQRRPLTYKDINYSWAASQESILIYRIAATEFKDKHFIKLLDQNTNSEYYIPFNAIMGFDEYAQLLERNNMTQDQFDQENDVHYLSPMTANTAEFKAKFRAIVNPLDEDDKLNVKVNLNFDSEKDKEADLNIKWQLYMKGDYPKSLLYDAIGLADEKEEIMKLLGEENQINMIMQELAKRPELMPKLQMLFREYDMQRQGQQATQQQQQQKPAAQQPTAA